MLPEKESADLASPTADRELVITRLLKAPVALVWEVWTDPDHIKNWWGPTGFSNTITQMDLRPGGEWTLVMHGPDGTHYKNKSIFKEVIRHKRIVYQHTSAPKFTATIKFEERGDTTWLTWHMLFETREEFIQTVKTFKADKGLGQNIQKLESYLTKGYAADEVQLTRLISAPAELVFRAWTDPVLLAKWWGPHGFTSPQCRLDPSLGGAIFIDMLAPTGIHYPIQGQVIEIAAPFRLVFTTIVLDQAMQPLFEIMNTLAMEGQGDKTSMRFHAQVGKQTRESAGYIKGITEGWNQSLDRLVNLLE